jgi:hypothetical protein
LQHNPVLGIPSQQTAESRAEIMIAFLTSLLISSQVVTVDVTFTLTELEKPDSRLAGVPVRVVLGEGDDWQGPDAGHRFVTDSKGEAHFTVQGIVDRPIRMLPVAMTGLSTPKRTDHMMIAVELEQLVPTPGSEYKHYQWLHTLDIDCYTRDDCATSDITGVYTRDKKGRFTVKGEPGPSTGPGTAGLKMPELGGMVLSGPMYKTTGLFLQPLDEARTRWKLNLNLQRKPAPVIR